MPNRDRAGARDVQNGPRLRLVGPEQARVWVLDEPPGGGSFQAVGIAERLGVPYRRVPLSWNWKAGWASLFRHGSLAGVAGGSSATARGRLPLPEGVAHPLLVVSSSSRSAAVALWLKARFGCRLVHCVWGGSAAWLGRNERSSQFDLLVMSEHDRPPLRDNVLAVVGAPHRIGPAALRQAAVQWGERLDHLPHPRVALLVGGPPRGTDMEPARAYSLGRTVARLAGAPGGSVLACTTRRTGSEASDTLAAGLGEAMHLIHRWGEPGENPYLGFLAMADAVIVTADSVAMLSEACATAAAVYVALPELAGARQRRLIAELTARGQVRPLRNELAPWSRVPLDETGRVAHEIRTRFPLS